jgi:hypothetical protein
MINRRTLALVFVLLLGGEARSEGINTLGAGVKASCGSWLAGRASNNYFSMGNWALGFLSGVAIYSTDLNLLEGVDSDAVAYWLNNYCQGRPTDRFVDALKAFIRQHPR